VFHTSLLGYAFAIPAYCKYDFDLWQFERHKTSHNVFENTCAKSKNHPKTNVCHNTNAGPNLLKSMEEYRQEFGKGMSLSHTLEDS